MSLPPSPLILPRADPSDLLEHMLAHHHRHPTTVVMANFASRADLVASLAADLGARANRHPLLSNTIHHAAVARHVRVVATPTVSHLRAVLAALPGSGGGVQTQPPPPPPQQQLALSTAECPPTACPACGIAESEPLLVAYGLVDAHRGTSEWSGQGLGATVAALVDACGHVEGPRAVLVEPTAEWVHRRGRPAQTRQFRDGEPEEVEGVVSADSRPDQRQSIPSADHGVPTLAENSHGWLGEQMPLISGSAGDAIFGGERKISVGRILGRWFRLVRPPLSTAKQQHQQGARPVVIGEEPAGNTGPA